MSKAVGGKTAGGRTRAIFGVAAALAFLTLGLAGCGKDDDDGGGSYTLPDNSGELTITGVDDYVGQYVYVSIDNGGVGVAGVKEVQVSSQDPDSAGYAVSVTHYKYVKVERGTVRIPLIVESSGYSGYVGFNLTGEIGLSVYFGMYEDSEIGDLSNSGGDSYTTRNGELVNFVSGKAAVDLSDLNLK